ncbi:MAG: helix-turn-helix domain-containing protein [Propionibacteriaceae bacterium]|nr:helix-turn-helix domain-containing protein [Propionibacteriaceae bacterium]
MYEQGQGIRPIATALGINRSVVRRVLSQHDVPRRGPTLPDHRTHEIRRLYDSGLSIAALAARLGVGKTTLQRFMHRNGITTRDRHGRVRAMA